MFEELIKRLMRENDFVREAEIEEDERFRRLQADIVRRAELTAQPQPQPKPVERRRFLPHYAFNPRNIWPKLAFEPEMQMALGAIILAFGLWVGSALPQKAASAQQIAAGQNISVMAMAEPWEGWIEGGE